MTLPDLPVEESADDSLRSPAGRSPADLPAGLRRAVAAVFGAGLDPARRYAELLVTVGVERGLLGPHEAPRVWDRHLLNCAVVGERIPSGASVVDVGSGAGLPGIVLAVSRPDLTVILLEPLARRVAFLQEVIADLRLDSVSVVRGRAEDEVGRVAGTVVTARAVAPLDRLVRWCLPLTVAGGTVLALKGARAVDEVRLHRAAVLAAGGGEPRLHSCGVGRLELPTTVIEVARRSPSARSRDSAGDRPGARRRRTG